MNSLRALLKDKEEKLPALALVDRNFRAAATKCISLVALYLKVLLLELELQHV